MACWAQITIGSNWCTIIADAGSKEEIEARVAQIKRELSETDSTYDTEKLSERIAKLAGGVAVIKVSRLDQVEVMIPNHCPGSGRQGLTTCRKPMQACHICSRAHQQHLSLKIMTPPMTPRSALPSWLVAWLLSRWALVALVALVDQTEYLSLGGGLIWTQPLGFARLPCQPC